MRLLTRRQKPLDTPSPIVSPAVIVELPQSSLRYVLVPLEMAARVLVKVRVATTKDRVTLRVICVTLRWQPSRHSLVELVSDLVDRLQLSPVVKQGMLKDILSAMNELTYKVGTGGSHQVGRSLYGIQAHREETEPAKGRSPSASDHGRSDSKGKADDGFHLLSPWFG